jgi:type II secretory pathway pseudopilin PulG
MKQSRRGFTIVELIIYMGILSLFLLVMTDTFSSIVDVRRDSEAVTVVEQDGNYLLAKLFYDISHASSIISPASLGSSSSALQLVINGVTNTYSISGGNLQVVNNNGTNVLNSVNSSISNLSFLRVGNTDGKNTIQLSFTVTSNITRASGPEVQTYQTSVGLR